MYFLRSAFIAFAMSVLFSFPCYAGWPAVNSNIHAGRNAIGAYGHVATDAALALASTSDYVAGVWRDDFAAGFGAEPLYFTPNAVGTCADNNMPNDGGMCRDNIAGGSFKAHHSKRTYDPLQWGAPHDGTDAAAQIQAVYDACKAYGGGTVDIGGNRFAIISADVKIRCRTVGSYVPHQLTTGDFTSDGGAFDLNPAHSLYGCRGGSLNNILVYNRDIPAPTDWQSSVAGINAFSGTGINVSTCDGERAFYFTFNDVQVLGFERGIDVTSDDTSTAAHHPIFNNVWLDNTSCLRITNSKDVTPLNHVECYPYLIYTAGTGNDPRTNRATVTGAEDNGSGYMRIHVDSTADLIEDSPQTWVAGVDGAYGANQICAVHIISSTVFDCLNVPYSPTVTAKVTSGSPAVVVSAASASQFPGLAHNQTVTSTGGLFPAGTRVVAISYPDYDTGTVTVFMDQNATGSSDTDTLNFQNDAYFLRTTVDGEGNTVEVPGHVIIDTWYRSGTAFEIVGTDALACTVCFAFDHKIGFDVERLQLATFTGSSVDGIYATKNRTAASFRFRTGFMHHNKFIGGYFANGPLVFQPDNSREDTGAPDIRAWPTTMDIEFIRQTPPGVPIVQVMKGGNPIVRVNSVHELSQPNTVIVMDAASKATFSGDYGDTDFLFENDSAYLKTNVIPGTVTAAGVAKTETFGGSTGATLVNPNQTVYFGQGGQTVNSDGRTSQLLPRPQTGHITGLNCSNTILVGTGQSQTITTRVNVGNTLATCSIADDGRNCSSTAVVPVTVAGYRLDWKLQTSSGAAPSGVQCEVKFQSP